MKEEGEREIEKVRERGERDRINEKERERGGRDRQRQRKRNLERFRERTQESESSNRGWPRAVWFIATKGRTPANSCLPAAAANSKWNHFKRQQNSYNPPYVPFNFYHKGKRPRPSLSKC